MTPRQKAIRYLEQIRGFVGNELPLTLEPKDPMRQELRRLGLRWYADLGELLKKLRQEPSGGGGGE